MDHTRDPDEGDRRRAGDLDPLETIGRLVSTIGAEIEALKLEREAAHARTARIRLGAAYARARLERRTSIQRAG